MRAARGVGAVLGVALALAAGRAHADGEVTPAGQALTPTAAHGAEFMTLNPGLAALPDFLAGQAAAVALSPDRRTLLVLTSGYNRNYRPDGSLAPELSNEYVFVFDVSGPRIARTQVLPMPNAFLGLAWRPDGAGFYVSGGVDDDVAEFRWANGRYAPGRRFAFGHASGYGLEVKPEVAGLAVSPDGAKLLAANLQNDSVSLIDLKTGAVSEISLRRPGARPGGSFPRAVAFVSNTRAYAAVERDREIVAIDLTGAAPHVSARLRTPGQPAALVAGPHRRLYAALDNTDAAAVIDTRSDRLLETIPTAAPPGAAPAAAGLGGAGTNAIAFDAASGHLLVSNGAENAVAVIALDPVALGGAPRAARRDDDGDDDAGAARSAVVGLIPTGWYPTAVAAGEGRIFVANGKSNAGPNPAACRQTLKTGPGAEAACEGANQYVWQLEKAGLLDLPAPGRDELARLTRIVAENDHFAPRMSPEAEATLAFVRAHVRHVIYIVKENRTYDQVLGDLEVGNGDPRLAVFGRDLTPNQHALASGFVDLDNFLDSGESSNTGWNWTTAARTNDFTEREAPVNYAGRGLQYDQEGSNRNLNMGFATEAERRAANPFAPDDPGLLPGARDVAAPDGPGGSEGQGYIWNAALRAGLTVRNWGFYGDLSLYSKRAGAARIPLERDPHAAGLTVFTPTKAALAAITDPYYRGFDQSFPDYWRVEEWRREFAGFVAKGEAPALMLVRLPHDHTGDFGEGLDGVDTVETEVADNDYAVGRLVETVAQSPFAKDTLVVAVEDDAQDGPDHVDAHRSLALFAGPYLKHGAVVSERHDTVDLVRTIEAVLGLAPMGLIDGLATPITDVFDPARPDWSFKARVPAALRTTRLPLPPLESAQACSLRPLRSARYWSAVMAGQDFSSEDRLDTGAYNRALWRGLKGSAPYPQARDARDLRTGRAELLAKAGAPCAVD